MKSARHNLIKNNLRGFTVVELIIVIVVIGILAGVVSVGYRGVTARAVNQQLMDDLKKAGDQLELDYVKKNVYPATASEVNDGAGFNITPGTVLDYRVSPLRKSFCLIATSNTGGTKTYNIVQEGRVSEGSCSTPTDPAPPTPPDPEEPEMPVLPEDNGDIEIAQVYNSLAASLHSNGTQATISVNPYPYTMGVLNDGYDLWSCGSGPTCKPVRAVVGVAPDSTLAWHWVEPAGTINLTIPAGTTRRFQLVGYNCYDANALRCDVSNVASVTRP